MKIICSLLLSVSLLFNSIDLSTLSEIFFNDIKIEKIYHDDELVWSNIKEPLYWVQNKQFLGNGFPTKLTLSGSASGTTSIPETDANSTTESNGATYATSEIVDTQDYKYLTVVFESVLTHGANTNYVDAGRFMVYSETNEELFYVATSGTYTVDISNVDKIYIKLFAGAWAWGNNQKATIVSLHFHDK